MNGAKQPVVGQVYSLPAFLDAEGFRSSAFSRNITDRPFLIVSAPTPASHAPDYGALSLETGNLVQVSYWVLLEAFAQGKRIA